MGFQFTTLSPADQHIGDVFSIVRLRMLSQNLRHSAQSRVDLVLFGVQFANESLHQKWLGIRILGARRRPATQYVLIGALLLQLLQVSG